jgi:hypothetical protein
MIASTPEPHRLFLMAVEGFRELVGRVEAGQWEAPGLGVWTVRDLTGHTARALMTVESYLRHPASSIEVADAVDYFRATLRLRAQHPELDDEIAARGREAGAELGPDPAAAVDALVSRVAGPVAAAAPDTTVTTIVGGMTLGAYLPTRTFELAVHGLDLAGALGTSLPDHYDEPLLAAADLAMRLAHATGGLQLVVRALLGRTTLPAGFSLI